VPGDWHSYRDRNLSISIVPERSSNVAVKSSNVPERSSEVPVNSSNVAFLVTGKVLFQPCRRARAGGVLTNIGGVFPKPGGPSTKIFLDHFS